MSSQPTENSADLAQQRAVTNGILCTLLCAFIFGVLSLAVAVWSFSALGQLWALASLIVGALGGFLFGIPKHVQADQREPGPNHPEALYEINSNLVQVSDWLTKTIIGVSLVQLNDLPQYLSRLGGKFAQACDPSQVHYFQAVGAGLVVYFAVLGFLGTYVLTRLWLTKAFKTADDQVTKVNSFLAAQAELRILPPDQSGPAQGSGPSESELQAARDLEQNDALDEESPLARRVVGKAAFVLGQNHRALGIFEGLTKEAGAGPEDFYNLGLVLWRLERKEDASDAFFTAAERTSQETDPSLRTNIYLMATYTGLYVRKPSGFRRTIKAFEKYTREFGPPAIEGLWVNAACAHAQDYEWRTQNGDSDVSAARDAAVEAIERALAIDPGMKSWLKALATKNDPSKNPEDNDLEVLADDAKVQELLDMKPPAGSS